MYDLIVTKCQYNCFGISLLCLYSVLKYFNSSSQINVDISSLSESPSPVQGHSMFGVRSHPGVLLHPVPLTLPLSHSYLHHHLHLLLILLLLIVPDGRKSWMLGVILQLENISLQIYLILFSLDRPS